MPFPAQGLAGTGWTSRSADILRALQETGFNRTAAAARLGISLRQMRYRIARLNIQSRPGRPVPAAMTRA
jgi:transcriptional regulator with GAF, ATPase, and Fis domain